MFCPCHWQCGQGTSGYGEDWLPVLTVRLWPPYHQLLPRAALTKSCPFLPGGPWMGTPATLASPGGSPSLGLALSSGFCEGTMFPVSI